jgi:hypothetical protein
MAMAIFMDNSRHVAVFKKKLERGKPVDECWKGLDALRVFFLVLAEQYKVIEANKKLRQQINELYCDDRGNRRPKDWIEKNRFLVTYIVNELEEAANQSQQVIDEASNYTTAIFGPADKRFELKGSANLLSDTYWDLDSCRGDLEQIKACALDRVRLFRRIISGELK